ncbi:mismatch-specific thymine-DNA glycosylate [Phlyctema vagabunda]|uniref:Mismatch-specific thymine-DNA glycosylate n=1 Tax=Phlyctema vagabunda TaxID=108571 RepID=A0ABR4PJI8_9HELO
MEKDEIALSKDGDENSIEEAEASTARPPASFAGKLNLASYSFTAASITTSRPKTNPSPSRTSPRLKRKADVLSTSQSPLPKKPLRPPAGYAPPSTYAHLPPLPDAIAEGLLVLFIGLNPGLQTSIQGHAYAHPSNQFWKLLHSSGCTTRRLKPQEDRSLPDEYSMGFTNIVARPTRNGAELSKREMDDSVAVLEDKIRNFKPEAVVVVGKSIWESIWRVRYGRPIKKDEFFYGWQLEKENMGKDSTWSGAKVFATTSTSGLAATPSAEEKERIWRELGVWVEQRRRERELDRLNGSNINT